MVIEFKGTTSTAELDAFLARLDQPKPARVELVTIYPYIEPMVFPTEKVVPDKRWIRLMGKQIDLNTLLYTAHPLKVWSLKAETKPNGHVIVTLEVTLHSL